MNLIKEWDSPVFAADSLGLDRVFIGNCARGAAKTAYGFIWRYKNPPKQYKICQYALNGLLLKEWGSVKEVFEQIGLSRASINNSIRGTTRTGEGFIWKRLEINE